MARLYLVNCTGQNRVVNYRFDFTVDDQGRRTSERLYPYKSISIRARQQIQFGGDLFPGQVQELVPQLERTCGAVNVNDVKTAKRMGVVKMIWSEDKPVPLSVLKDVVAHNMGLLSDQGARRRQQLALAADMTLTNLITRPAPKMEMEFESADQDEYTPQLAEGLRVSRASPPSESPSKRNSRRKAA